MSDMMKMSLHTLDVLAHEGVVHDVLPAESEVTYGDVVVTHLLVRRMRSNSLMSCAWYAL